MNRRDLANAITAAPVSPSDTYIKLQPNYVSGMPAPLFQATITPFGQLPTAGNSEIVLVAGVSGDTLEVQRGQLGTKPKSFPAGSIVSNGIYTNETWGKDNINMLPFSYNTFETDTGMTFIDGKTVYRAVASFNTISDGAEKGLESGIFEKIDTLIKFECILNDPRGERYPNGYTNPAAPSTQYFQAKMGFYNGKRQLRYSTRTAGTVVLVMEYTRV